MPTVTRCHRAEKEAEKEKARLEKEAEKERVRQEKEAARKEKEVSPKSAITMTTASAGCCHGHHSSYVCYC